MMQRLLTAISVCVVAVACSPTLSLACVLDNQSSLSANGNAAIKDPHAGAVSFSFERVYGRDGSIRFSENMSDLRKSLTPAELAHRFLWRWGDGTYSIAWSPTHVFRRLGTFQIAIYAYGTAEGDGWSPFDRARVQIVPAGEVWRDNLGYTVLDAFGFTLHWAVRLGLGVFGLIVAYGLWQDWRRGQTQQCEQPVMTRMVHSGQPDTE
jgi:hypothetical protein